MKQYWVYVLTNRSGTLYIGMTNDLVRRVREHKAKRVPGFTRRYNVDRLVYFEEFGEVRDAIQREKQLKGWLRTKKIELIEQANPRWDDLGSAL
ncbi:MAG: GIY-YIG nuclease family protein [Rhodothermales bacterium]